MLPLLQIFDNSPTGFLQFAYKALLTMFLAETKFLQCPFNGNYI